MICRIRLHLFAFLPCIFVSMFHVPQVCEGVKAIGKNRKERLSARDFISLNDQTAKQELMDYLGNTYDLKNTVIISNGDGGAGYTKNVFDELSGQVKRHEFFLDGFHVNKKIKERLNFSKALQDLLMKALWLDYDRAKVDRMLDTAESLLIDELDAVQNQEQVRKLRAYLDRNWVHLKPYHQRGLSAIPKVIGACESNHRQYTYRMKGQGKYWSTGGAEGLLRIIASLKNKDFDRWLMSEYEAAEPLEEFEKRARKAVRAATAQRWNKAEPHVGAHQVRIVGREKSSTGMSKLAKAWSY